jgi:hypothetical protein
MPSARRCEVLRTNPWAFMIFTSTGAGFWPTARRPLAKCALVDDVRNRAIHTTDGTSALGRPPTTSSTRHHKICDHAHRRRQGGQQARAAALLVRTVVILHMPDPPSREPGGSGHSQRRRWPTHELSADRRTIEPRERSRARLPSPCPSGIGSARTRSRPLTPSAGRTQRRSRNPRQGQ